MIFILLFLWLFTTAKGQTADLIKWPDMEKMLAKQDDTVRIFNFWATWCAPCVKELPEFARAKNQCQDAAVIFYFISLDFKRDYEKRLIPFLAKNPLPGPVFLLDEPDYNRWIDQIDRQWEGSIPATLFQGPAGSLPRFYEGELNAEQIMANIKTLKLKTK